MLLALAGASQIVLRCFYFIDDQYTAESYLWYFTSLGLLWAYSRPFSMERLRAWLAGKPEPKSKSQDQPAPAHSSPAE
jgi:hypothetical protein